VDEFHGKGIRVMMDAVFNHTSDQHDWFEASRNPDHPEHEKYRNFYHWSGDYPGEENDFPGHWSSVFHGGEKQAWSYDDERGEHYLHRFHRGQPDLNWGNQDVREEVYEAMSWWQEEYGIDGFRFDVANFLVGIEHAPLEDDAVPMNVDPDGEGLTKYYREMYEEAVEDGNMVIAEMPGVGRHMINAWTGDEMLDSVISFDFPEAENTEELQEAARRHNKGDMDAVAYLNNHDHPRAISKFARDSEYREEASTLLAAYTLLQRGNPILFQGEEVSMANIDWEKVPSDSLEDPQDSRYIDDIEAVLEAERMLDEGLSAEWVLDEIRWDSRDNSRVPRWWPEGFTDEEPWLKAPGKETDREVRRNVEEFYRDLIELRHDRDVFTEGKFVPLYDEDPNNRTGRDIMGWAFNGEESLAIVMNMSETPSIFWSEIELIDSDAEELLNNVRQKRDTFDTNEPEMQPYEASVISVDSPLEFR
jgi:glycosidase